MNSNNLKLDNPFPTRNAIRRVSQEVQNEDGAGEELHRQQQQQQPIAAQPAQQQQAPSGNNVNANGSATTSALSSLATNSTGRQMMQHIKPKTQSSVWFVKEILKRTDLHSGDICMFHCKLLV